MTAPGDVLTGGLPAPGELVVVAGFGVTGQAVVAALLERGLRVVITADRRRPDLPVEFIATGRVQAVADLPAPPPGTRLVVTSPGFRPDIALQQAARAAGIEVIGDVELAWRLDRAAPRPWVVVTGTNGKTTTIGMVESILRAAGRRVTACGNVGWPAVSAVLAEPRQEVLVAELSSFQLHYAPSVRPLAGAVLNVAADHLDWYGGGPGGVDDATAMAAYAGDKARALTGTLAIAVADDPGAAALLAASRAAIKITVSAGSPPPAAVQRAADGNGPGTAAGAAGTGVALDGGALGVHGGWLWDAAFGYGPLLPVDEIRPAGRHNVSNALAAAALAMAVGATGADVAGGLRAFVPGDHRNVVVGRRGGVTFIDDSKATNPHAAAASLAAYPQVVWIAGGQLKGAPVDELVERFADRLSGAVVLGVDAPLIMAALSRHAPDVPAIQLSGTDDGAMTEAVRAAMSMASAGDVVLLAPAAASLDMFSSYAARGRAFQAAVQAVLSDADAPGSLA